MYMSEQFQRHLSLYIRGLLVEKNLSVKTIAKKVGLSSSSLHRLLNRGRRITSSEAIKIAGVFSDPTSSYWLLERDGQIASDEIEQIPR